MPKSKFASSDKVQALSPYVGSAGEHYVISELILRQFDTALVAVDNGIDILAEKNNKLVRVQVKTRRLGDDDASSFLLSEKSLNRKKLPDFYIVVLMDFTKWKMEPFVFPRFVIKSFLRKGLLTRQKRQKRYRGQMIRRRDKWYIRNQQHDITKYYNAFNLIKV